MDDAARSGRRGPWAFLLAQPRSPTMLLPALLIGLSAAAITGLVVGFDANDDPAVSQVRMAAPLLAGFVGGLVGRGVWGWVAASVGAAAGMAPFLLEEQDLATGLLGGLLLSLPVLAPGYALARALAYASRLWSLDPQGRAAAVRGPLRRLLRAGILVSGGLCLVVVITLSAGGAPGVATAAMVGTAITGTYALYRLIDQLDRGVRLAAVPFTVLFVPIGVLASGFVVASRLPDTAWASTMVGIAEMLAPSLFMALAPWVLVRIVERQQPPVSWPSAPGEDRQRRLPLGTTIVGLAALGCLAVAVLWLVGSGGANTLFPAGPVATSHDAPDVEELLPASVAGRPLATWSVRGEATLRLWGMTADEIRRTAETLAASGVDLEDVVQATAGRSDVGADPPYFVLAFRIPEASRDLLGGRAIFASGFTRDTDQWQLEDRIVGGKSVSVGPMDLLVQNDHQRGRPYLYGSTALNTSFIVITDDEAWAAEAISKLPE
jgi:hypothetical protein